MGFPVSFSASHLAALSAMFFSMALLSERPEFHKPKAPCQPLTAAVPVGFGLHQLFYKETVVFR